VFCNEVKGKRDLALSRDLRLPHKSAFVLLHKRREAMAEEMKGHVVGGEGKTTEADGEFRRLFQPRQHERKPPRSSPELVADYEQLMKTGLARKSTYRLPRSLRRAA
jgi:hypothetical protein